MDEQKTKIKEEFDRSLCFTFFKSYHEQIMNVKEEFGLEEAFKVYEAIVDFGLFGTETTCRRTKTLMGATTLEQIETSQNKRSKSFSGENYEQTKVVSEYMRDHPKASQRSISLATKISKTKVAKVQKNIRESGFESIEEYLKNVVYPNININDNYNNNVNDNNNYRTGTETSPRDQSQSPVPSEEASPDEALPQTESSTPTTQQTTQNNSVLNKDSSNKNLTWEQKEKIIDIWKKCIGTGKSPNNIADSLNLDRSLVNECINAYKNNDYKLLPKPKEKDILLKDGSYLSWTKEELFNILTDNGTIAADDIEWELVEENYINSMNIDNFVVKCLIKEFKEKLSA